MATGAPTAQRQTVPVRHRPNIEEMTEPQVRQLREAFAAMKAIADDRGYTRYAALHGLPLPISCGIAHGQPAFLPWHRAYLYRFEQALRDTGFDVMLPWWDWTKTQRVPLPFEGELTPEGDANPLWSARIPDQALAEGKLVDPEDDPFTPVLAGYPDTFREPGRLRASLPSGAEIQRIMKLSEYEDFRREVEDPHGQVHMWVGGHMASVPFSAFDPLFWAHHCMVDRLWRIWQLEFPEASFPTAIRGLAMEPFNMTAADVLDPTTLGYDYAISIAQVPAAP